MKQVFAVLLLLFGMVGLALLAATVGLDQMVTQIVKKATDGNQTCEITRKLGAFNGHDTGNEACITEINPDYSIFDNNLLDFSLTILYLYIGFIFAAMIPGLVTVAVALYNVFSRPYQTFADITAFMLYFALTGGLALLAMIMYLVLWLSEFPNSLPKTGSNGNTIVKGAYIIESTGVDISFWLLCGAVATTIFGIVVAVLANKDARRMKENEDFIEQKGGNTNDIFSL